MSSPDPNPYHRKPDHPNFNRRARHHDYNRPARYLITTLKNPCLPPFSSIVGDSSVTEGATAPHPELNRTGEIIQQAVEQWLRKYPQIEVPEFVIMPDHIHLCVHVKEYLPKGLSLAMSDLKGTVSRLRHNALPDDKRPQKMVSVFKRGFNDRIAYNDEQWERQKNYVRENPRRYLIKKLFPAYMLRRWSLKIGDEEFIAKGNILLLKEPGLFVAKHYRKWTTDESENFQKQSRLKIENGDIPVSPFIHPKEKEIRDYAIHDGGCYIRICTNGFAERESASGSEFDLMAEGRLLLIAPAHFETTKQDLKYSYAQRLNAVAFKLVDLCQKGESVMIHR